jgi:hypothetical protein
VRRAGIALEGPGSKEKPLDQEKGGSGMNSWQLSKVGAMGAMLGLMMCVGAMAQMPGGGGGQMPPNQQSPMPQQPNGPGNPTDNLPGVQGNSRSVQE